MAPKNQRSGINRGLMWLRRSLEITEQTESPQTLSELLRPMIDVFGWDRLAQASTHESPFTAAPGTITTSAVVPDNVVRVYLNAAVRHTDTGVSHFLWIEKSQPRNLLFTGVTAPNIQVPPLVPQSAPHWIIVEPGGRLRGRTDIALVAGAIAMDMSFIDLPLGEYICAR